MTPVAVSAQVTLPTGAKLSASIAVPVVSPILAGFDVSPLANETVVQAFIRVGKLVPGATYVRAYDQPGRKFTQTPWGSGALAAMPPNATPHISTKDSPDPDSVNAELAAATKPWFWTIHHEPEGDLTVAQYKADYALAAQLIAAHPNGHLCTLVEVFTEYAQRHGNKPGYMVADMWTGRAPIIGMDCYRDGTIDGTVNYPAPEFFFGWLIKLAATLKGPDGKPPRIMIPEFGGTLVAGDTGAKRAAWITACFAYMRANGFVAVGWWFTGGEDLTNDALGLAALQKAIAGK